jgi:hypothetical protein
VGRSLARSLAKHSGRIANDSAVLAIAMGDMTMPAARSASGRSNGSKPEIKQG